MGSCKRGLNDRQTFGNNPCLAIIVYCITFAKAVTNLNQKLKRVRLYNPIFSSVCKFRPNNDNKQNETKGQLTFLNVLFEY